MSPREMTATSVVPPPMSTIRLPGRGVGGKREIHPRIGDDSQGLLQPLSVDGQDDAVLAGRCPDSVAPESARAAVAKRPDESVHSGRRLQEGRLDEPLRSGPDGGQVDDGRSVGAAVAAHERAVRVADRRAAIGAERLFAR